jgi:cation diffusion facilitator CzcD-associated flavoprotein CzcO
LTSHDEGSNQVGVAVSDEQARFDPAAVRARYEAERDKRMVEGRAAIRDLAHDDAVARYRQDPFTPLLDRDPVHEDVEGAIIGAGIAGVVAGAQLRKHGIQSIRLIDQAGGFGGTWYWNRYPGVMCDVESYCYLPMLEEMEYVPTKRYAQGEEIREHVEAIARRFDLVESARFHTGVQHTEWDEQRAQWLLRTDRGDEIRAKYVIMAVGILNLMKIPDIPGMESFAGAAFHTARWDYEYTGGSQEDPRMTRLADKVVGIIGTGASAVQAIPPLAESSKHLYVFQRTPAAVGVRGDRPTGEEFAQSLRPGWHRDRNENFQAVMLGQPVDDDLVDDGWCHHFARINNQPFAPGMAADEYMFQVDAFDYEVMELHRRRIRDTITDPARAELLMPYYKYSCRRPLFHDEYLPAMNRDDVTVVDCPSGIDRITEHGVVVGDREYELDCIVYATGFEPEVTPLPRRVGHEIVGRDGTTIADKWADGAATLFGLMTSGFPNLFLMPCPGQQAVVTVNYTLLAEVGAEHVAATIAALDAEGVDAFDVSEDAEADWVRQVMTASMASAPPPGGVPCTPGSRMLFDDDGNMVLLDPHAGTYGGGFGDYFGYRDLLAQWRARGDFAGLILDRPSSPTQPQQN